MIRYFCRDCGSEIDPGDGTEVMACVDHPSSIIDSVVCGESGKEDTYGM